MNIKERINLLVLFLFFYGNTGMTQETELKSYKFNDNIIEIPEEYKNENEVILERNIKIEYIVTKKKVLQYYLVHEKIFINSDDAIERNNKVYIPFSLDESLITNLLRIKLKNGSFVELNKKDIKEEIDNERRVKYNYYAIKGLEKGAIIEKLFLIEESPEFNGKSIKFNNNYPIVKTSFEMIFPKHLIFKYKSYNGLTEAKFKLDAYEDKNNISFEAYRIKGFSDRQKYSNEEPYIKMFRYKLDANSATGAKNLGNYKDFASSVFENIQVELDKKGLKKISDFCSTITKSDNLDDQIWNIEYKIKGTVSLNTQFEGNEDMLGVLSSKQASFRHLAQLYTAVFNYFNFDYQAVFTSKRFQSYFDNEFELTFQLQDLLFYFPKKAKYLEPGDNVNRYPFFNFNYGENYGLFIKPKLFAGVNMGIGELELIKFPEDQVTHDSLDIVVDFTKDINNPAIRTINKYSGYSAANYQYIKEVVSADRYKEILKDLCKRYTNKIEPKTVKALNDGFIYASKRPFVLDVQFDGSSLIQRAGDKILFKVGETIGEQVELYQEDKRILPVEIYYPHLYTRRIKLIMPKGYSVENLDKFNFNKVTILENKKVALFESSYQVNGNEITVNNNEFYYNIKYPMEVFESYKEVVNAAADFNKITLVLTKK